VSTASIVGCRSPRVAIRRQVDVRLSEAVHASFTASRPAFTAPLYRMSHA
jgi:hypothetical protein